MARMRTHDLIGGRGELIPIVEDSVAIQIFAHIEQAIPIGIFENHSPTRPQVLRPEERRDEHS